MPTCPVFAGPVTNCDGDEYYRYEHTSDEYLQTYSAVILYLTTKVIFRIKDDTLQIVLHGCSTNQVQIWYIESRSFKINNYTQKLTVLLEYSNISWLLYIVEYVTALLEYLNFCSNVFQCIRINSYSYKIVLSTGFIMTEVAGIKCPLYSCSCM